MSKKTCQKLNRHRDAVSAHSSHLKHEVQLLSIKNSLSVVISQSLEMKERQRLFVDCISALGGYWGNCWKRFTD